jgi:phosphonate transport system substrate-binding protein
MRITIFLLLCASVLPTRVPAEPPTVRFGVSETLPFFDHRLMSDWGHYLQQRLGREVEVVHRGSHNDIFELLANGDLEFAGICPAIYQRHQTEVSLVAMPLFNDDPNYQMLLLGPADEAAGIDSIEALRDKVVAFAEPDTNFGSNLVERALQGRGIDPNTFFRRTFYTGDHDKVLLAVANGLAHGGAVTNQTWEALRHEAPDTAARLRVIWRSGLRPLPPIVTAPGTPPSLAASLSAQLQGMQDTPVGRRILARLHFDRFVAGDPRLFADGQALGQADTGADTSAETGADK